MACLKQTHELEALNHEQLGKLFSFKHEKAYYRKTYMDWDKIKRANNKAIREKATYLSKDAQAILAPVIQNLERGKRVILNHKYISKITKCKRRQNQNIIKQLASVLDITYHNSITVDSKKHRYSYEFSYTLEKSENISSPENSIGQFPAEQNDSLYIQKENKDIEDIDLGSNFLKNSEKVFISEVVNFSKIPSKNKTRLPNQRKKPTNAENKAKVFLFNQYKQPKNLSDHYPLTQEDCSVLQSNSSREFTLNAMNQILLDMSKRLNKTFCSKAQFLAYFAKCLRYEKRDAVKTANTGFYIKANIPKEHLYFAKREDYLSQIEQKPLDLNNRTTNGFQLIPDIINKLLIKMD